ncbi:SDR family oxidoreductase [Rhodoligotrophos defluvii]|uniref:SDR family oxidoreductase n=1 Tax=Rhodoligotrophos defluvii TaxID=2561934 RepID=UPI0010C9F70D|nr:SDR family oxidoreductase [Rhodoligotrophos defluvii]
MTFNRSEQPRTVIVTGAAAGIGRAIAHRFASGGDRIGLIARDADALAAVRREIRSMGAEAEFAVADVADAEAVFAAAEQLEQKLGDTDIWINNAMETVFSTVADMSPEEFRRVTEVTYLGFVHGTMAALKSMRPRRKGHIMQMGSALAYRGIPLQSAYCGAKHAIRGFTDSLRAELIAEDSNIKLTVIDLPAVNTPQFDWARAHIGRQPRPMGRPVQPEVVADAVFRAAEGRWREYWLGFSTMKMVLGSFVAPGYVDTYLARHAFAGQQRRKRIAPDREDNLDHPITELHRTRGSFSSEARESAPLIAGEVVRAGAIAAGALFFFGLGASLGAGWRSRRDASHR